MKDRLDGKIDEALGAWPEIDGHADDVSAAKTMNKIRANFPPKSKLTTSDDALLAAPLPATREEWAEENAASQEKSSQIDVPMGRASSIPPPSSGVSRSEKAAADSGRALRAEKRVETEMGQVERQRERTSFKDLAALAATPPPSSTKPSARIPIAAPSSQSGDSGVVDLQAAALSDPQAAERAKSTPLASGSLFEDDGPQSVPPPSLSGELRASGPHSAVQSVPQQIDPYSPASVRPSLPPSSQGLSATLASAGPHSATAALAAKPVAQTTKKSPVLAILGGVLAVSAIAAGTLLFVKMHHAAPAAAADKAAPVAVAQNDVAPQAAQADTNAQATPDSTDPQAVAQNGVAIAPNAIVAKSAGKPVAHASKAAAPVKAGGGGNALADAMEKDTSSTPPAPPPVAANTTPPPATGGSADLQNAMKTAVGPSDSTSGAGPADTKAAGPKFAPGTVPQRPSQGALASAIGRVLPDARSCLGPDDGVSYATIVFESAGGTQNVTLSGFAANKPAGACITTALKKANVGPFAETTYSAKVTVRP